MRKLILISFIGIVACTKPIPLKTKEVEKPEMSVSEIAAKTEAALESASDECLREPECVSDLLDNI